MPATDINFWAVLAGAVVHFIIGGVWYSLLFGEPWMKLSGITKEQIESKSGSQAVSYASTFGLLLVLSYVLAHVLAFTGADTFNQAVMAGLWLWLGFVATTMTITSLFAGQPLKLTAINAGYYLVGIVAAAAVITAVG